MSAEHQHAQTVSLDPEPSEIERLAALVVALDDRLRGIERFLGLDPSGRQRIKRDLSVKEAAHLLKRSVSTTKDLCAAGRLPGARKIHGQWSVPRAAIKGHQADAVKGR